MPPAPVIYPCAVGCFYHNSAVPFPALRTWWTWIFNKPPAPVLCDALAHPGLCLSFQLKQWPGLSLPPIQLEMSRPWSCVAALLVGILPAEQTLGLCAFQVEEKGRKENKKMSKGSWGGNPWDGRGGSS